MAKQWQIRRGSSEDNRSFIGAEGEITLDTELDVLHIHDGSTQGGIVIPHHSELVHNTGNETIQGTKTFKDNRVKEDGTSPHFNTINNSVNVGHAVSGSHYSGLLMTDKTEQELGYVRHNYYTTSDEKNISSIEVIAIDPDTSHTHTAGNRLNTQITITADGQNRSATLNFNPNDASDDTQIATTKWVKDQLKLNLTALPVGSVTAYSGTNTPDGWLKCDGRDLSVTTEYQRLYEAIGHRYDKQYWRCWKDSSGNNYYTKIPYTALCTGDKVYVQTTNNVMYQEYDSVANSYQLVSTGNLKRETPDKTKTGGIISGFTKQTDYIILPTLPTVTSSFEFVAKIHIPSSISSDSSLMNCTEAYGIVINLTTARKIKLYLSSVNTNSRDIANGTAFTTVLDADTDYYIKFMFDGALYTISYSTDGVNYTQDTTTISSTKIIRTDKQQTLGGTSRENVPFGGTIDLNGCYIKVDDQLVFPLNQIQLINNQDKILVPDSDKDNLTFNLPDLCEKVPVMALNGVNDGNQGNGWVPNITGQVDGVSNRSFYAKPTASDAFYVDSFANNQFSGGGGIANNSALLHIDASRCSKVYKSGKDSVVPAYSHMLYLIKYKSTAEEREDIMNLIYPVGAIYLGTTATCPLTVLMPHSTWELVSQDRVLQGSSSSHAAGSTIEAGLPNITYDYKQGWLGDDAIYEGPTGALTASKLGSRSGSWGHDGSYAQKWQMSFDASRSSAVYGKSTTVQPPAYVINVWRRTA